MSALDCTLTGLTGNAVFRLAALSAITATVANLIARGLLIGSFRAASCFRQFHELANRSPIPPGHRHAESFFGLSRQIEASE
jgi:hypothetical protein